MSSQFLQGNAAKAFPKFHTDIIQSIPSPTEWVTLSQDIR